MLHGSLWNCVISVEFLARISDTFLTRDGLPRFQRFLLFFSWYCESFFASSVKERRKKPSWTRIPCDERWLYFKLRGQHQSLLKHYKGAVHVCELRNLLQELKLSRLFPYRGPEKAAVVPATKKDKVFQLFLTLAM